MDLDLNEQLEVNEFMGLTDISTTQQNDQPPVASPNPLPIDDGEDQPQTTMSSTTSFSSESDANGANLSMESDSNINTDSAHSLSLREDLGIWFHEERITRESGSRLLTLLRRYHPELPQDPRTLSERSGKEVNVVKRCGGDYYYLGVIKSVISILSSNENPPTDIKLQVSVDGLPLFKSSSKQFWPILVAANHHQPFVAALFYGDKKPDNVNEFMSDIIAEIKAAQGTIELNGNACGIAISAIVADAPARAFLKQIVSHNGYHGCERCEIVGERKLNRTVYLGTNYQERTNEAFNEMKYADTHQNSKSPLIGVVDCVTGFVLDYMHLVCLGIVRRLMRFWKTEATSPVRLSPSLIRALSSRLEDLNGTLPSEITRQPRSLFESDRWKATEYRSFLLYTGIVVLNGILPKEHYDHFCMLMVGIYIVLDEDEKMRTHYLAYSRQLLTYFVERAPKLYGAHFVTYNVHSLIHLADDCENHGESLNHLNAFPFENSLGCIKRMVRNGNNPIVQVVKKLKNGNTTHIDKKLTGHLNRLGNNLRDSGILLKDGRLALIKSMEYDGIHCKIVPKRLESDVFTTPIKSSEVNIIRIASGDLHSLPTEIIPLTSVKKKCTIINSPTGPDVIFIPMRHLY